MRPRNQGAPARKLLQWGAFLAALGGRTAHAEPAPEDPYPSDPIDVTVQGPPTPADTTTLTRAEARGMPGAFGDPFRAIEALPGVAPIVSGVPFFYVRGSPPGNVGYFLDGIRLPLLFHMGLGPSVVHPALIGGVELTPGPVPELGRHSGGAVYATLAEPGDRVHVEGSLRAVDTGAFVEVPFDDARGSAMAAGRVSYAGWLFSLAQSETSLGYWDYASRVSYEVAPGTRVSVLGFGAFDYLSEKQEDGEDLRVFDTTFHRVDLRLDQTIDDRTSLRHDVILGWDQTGLDQDREVIDKLLQVRSQIRHDVADGAQVRAGLEMIADDYSFDLNRGADEGFVDYFDPRTDISLGAWAVVPLRLGRLALIPGLRADAYLSAGDSAASVDPSLATDLAIVRGLSLVSAHGLSSQMPSFIVAGPGFRPGLDQGGLQRVFHSSAGLIIEPERLDASAGAGRRLWTIKAILYRVGFFDINDALGTSPLSGEGFPDGFGQFDGRFLGTSTGLELSVRRRLRDGVGMALAYSVGRSERSNGAERLPSGFDRTHVASAAFSFDFGRGFLGGLKNVFYTGAPLVEDDGADLVVEDRLGPFYRLDWRFEKRWTLGRAGWISLVAEVANTFLAAEEIGQDCEYVVVESNLQQRCSRTTLGPVTIPSIGVEGGYN
ncbi:MAG: energy transducer TonB [Myxococcales bacterium]|nr:energy transducer TonB [Myxococcales bacterium]